LRESITRWNSPSCNNQEQQAARRSDGKNIERLGPKKSHNSKVMPDCLKQLAHADLRHF
jgi:hypothetical protein